MGEWCRRLVWAFGELDMCGCSVATYLLLFMVTMAMGVVRERREEMMKIKIKDD
jgi:hypothetical protein